MGQHKMSDGQDQVKNTSSIEPALYVIATPIGHLKDITHRALEVLKGLDVLACEDTRVTAKLLSAYGIHVPTLLAYHDHNADEMRPSVLAKLAAGMRVGIVSDAGTPLISDPGFKLVRDANAAGIKVVPIPGASALLAALVGAGLPTDQFHFAGFLPHKSGARQHALQALLDVKGSLAIYESTHRLPESIADMASVLGADRPACVAREMTKQFEEFRHGTLGELAAHYARAGSPKGEAVVVIGPAPAQAQAEISTKWQTSIEALVRAGTPTKAVVEALHPHIGGPRDVLYEAVLHAKNHR